MVYFTDEYDKRVYINPKYVTAVGIAGNSYHLTVIYLTGTQSVEVKESIEEVVHRIGKE